MPRLALAGSKIRKTIFSPCIMGKVLTRKSMWRVLDRTNFMRPSCGMRFSEMSILEITLMREANFSLMARGGWLISLRMPSTR